MRAERQKGISLLEVLFVLVVASVIMSSAVMYYSHTVSVNRVSQAANLIQEINKAGYEWLQTPNPSANPDTIYPENFTGLNNAQDGNGLNFFYADKLIPCENKSCFTNPWGGSITVTSGAGYPRNMLITLTKLPDSDCALLRQQLINIAPENIAQQNNCVTDKGISTYQVYL